MRIKLIIRQVIGLTILCALLCGILVTQAQAADAVAPSDQNTVVNMTFDKVNPPAKLFIWNRVFGGSSDGCNSNANCKDQDSMNNLVCYSSDVSLNGACPTLLFWNSKNTPDHMSVVFKHQGTGQKRYLSLYSHKGNGTFSSWVASAAVGAGFTTYFTADELKNKLDLAGTWKAELLMRVLAWDNCSDMSKGCPGIHRAKWTANITLKVVDFNNQQIYLPAFPTATPVIDLNLVTRSGARSGKTVSGSTSLDMCLYDGTDSESNRISLIFQDEGAAAAGRPKGQFSLYRGGGDKAKARDRLDYQVSVINPTTGATQVVSNGTEIIWSDTNRRDIQRQVILPGVSTPALCVPAPLTLKTPTFSLADKTGGDYSGRLRIIYTPTIQTSQ